MPFADTTTLRIYYERHGSGCPVLLIGGVGGDLRGKAGLLEKTLANSFDLLTFDQRGTGQTDKPDAPCTMADYARDAAALLDTVGWTDCHVVGVSFGGMVAQELVLRFPGYVRSLVLACTASGGAGGSSYPLHELSDLSPGERARKMLAIADVRKNEAWQATHPEQTELLLKEAAAAASPFLKEPGGIQGLTRQIEARSHHDTYDRLRQIKVPVLVCGGCYDGQASPDVVENLQRHISGAEIRFFEGGHRFLNEDPEASKAVAQFLEHQCHTGK